MVIFMDLCRLELLIGDKINLINNKTVLIIGIGGVGGYAFEALVRGGISNITIVDYDIKGIISEINCNIDITNSSTINKLTLDLDTYLKDITNNLFLDIKTNNTDILKATTVEDTSNTDNIYSAINISKFRTCGSGKKYKHCCGKKLSSPLFIRICELIYYKTV